MKTMEDILSDLRASIFRVVCVVAFGVLFGMTFGCVSYSSFSETAEDGSSSAWIVGLGKAEHGDRSISASIFNGLMVK